ncbi:hypothetical protein ACFFRR_003108 [Megaselia abdita]
MFSLETEYNLDKKIWSGPKKVFLFNPEASIGSVIWTCLKRQHPKNILQINDSENTSLTTEKVLEMSSRIAYNILLLNIRQSDVVGIISRNTTNLMPLCYGLFYIGVPFHALDHNVNMNLALHSFGTSRPKIIFCEKELYRFAKSVIVELDLNCAIYTIDAKVNGVNYLRDLLVKIPEGVKFQPSFVRDSNQTAVISNSSGSTGLNKAITISHRILLVALSNLVEKANTIYLGFFSLSWEGGIEDYLNPGITGCTMIVTNRETSGDELVYLIEKYRVTSTSLMPYHISQILNSTEIQKRSITSLREILTIGSKLSTKVLERFQKHLSPTCLICDNYGCSERGTISLQYQGSKPGIYYNTDVKVIDENNNNLGPNRNGQICVRKGIPWSGYYRNESSTKEIYDSVGDWYKTGDMGRFDEDSCLHLIERMNDIIQLENCNISPSEVEEIVLEIEDVVQTCVVGAGDKSVAAFVVKKFSGCDLQEGDVKDYVFQRIPIRLDVYFVNKLPMTSTGKVIRNEVAGLLRQ